MFIRIFFLLTCLVAIPLVAEIKRYKPGNKQVVAFAPHPDDDVLGCGGSLIHHIKQGGYVTVVYMTSGNGSSWHGTKEELAVVRENEARKAAVKIGIQKLLFLREPDGALARSEKNVRKVVDLLRSLQPDVVYIPHSMDNHPDHKATYWLVQEAAQVLQQEKKRGIKVPLILCYEVWTPLSSISHKVDISQEIDLKLAALAEHVSQLPTLNVVDAVKGLNRYRGIMNYGGTYAECFKQLEF